MNVGSLFAGIAGFDLGLERAGMRTSWFCEQNPYCQRVLNERWPGIPVYPDITELVGTDVEPVDVLCGGFPCQDLSSAGRGDGIDGARSGLWSEYARLIGELRPRYVVVENVSALLARGMGRVLGDLAALGYDAEWDCLPASAFGAPHQRDRIWIVAYPDNEKTRGDADASGRGNAQAVADTERPGLEGTTGERLSGEGRPLVVAAGGGAGQPNVADTSVFGQPGSGQPEQPKHSASVEDGQAVEPFDGRVAGLWPPEPEVGRVVDGFPGRVDQLAALGNALVPQIAEWIGTRILEWEGLK